jgi:hypothetical protein
MSFTHVYRFLEATEYYFQMDLSSLMAHRADAREGQEQRDGRYGD